MLAVVLPEAAGEPDGRQTVKLSEVLKYNLRTVRAYLLREEFQRFWEYTSRRGPGSSGRMDEPRDAFAARADEEGRADDAHSPAVDSELVPCPKARSRQAPWRGSTTR